MTAEFLPRLTVGSCMGAFEHSWQLLKDFSFLRDFPEDYVRTLPQRMKEAMASRRGGLEHIDARGTHPQHYHESKDKRYHDKQKLPKGFKGFTLEDISDFVANDLMLNNPHLLEAMKKPSLHNNEIPTMQFDLMSTDTPKHDPEFGLQHKFSPIYGLHPDGKVGRVSTTSGLTNNANSIKVVPSTSALHPSLDSTNNNHIQPGLNNRFALREVDIPDISQQTITENPEQPTQQSLPEGMPPLNPNLPDWAKQQFIQQWQASNQDSSDVQTGEPMDIAMQLLKAPIYADELGESPPTEQSRHYEMLGNLEQFGGFMWQSKDGMARGTLRPDFFKNSLLINNFEMAGPVRGQGQSRDYLQDMIDQGHEYFDYELDGTHVTNVEPHTAMFWNKLVDEGVLDGAHERSHIRTNLHGDKHFVHAYNNDKMRPWMHELSEDYADYHDLPTDEVYDNIYDDYLHG